MQREMKAGFSNIGQPTVESSFCLESLFFCPAVRGLEEMQYSISSTLDFHPRDLPRDSSL